MADLWKLIGLLAQVATVVNGRIRIPLDFVDSFDNPIEVGVVTNTDPAA